jgi:transposase-like protein
MAVRVAVAVNTDGRREILGITVLPPEAFGQWPSPFRADFLRSLTRRGLRGVQLAICDAHEGLKAAARKVLGAGWQRCRVHFQRNLLARVSKTHKPVVSAVVKTVFAETERDHAHARWRAVADIVERHAAVGVLTHLLRRRRGSCENRKQDCPDRPHPCNVTPRWRATVKMSLSPRPHMFITIR